MIATLKRSVFGIGTVIRYTWPVVIWACGVSCAPPLETPSLEVNLTGAHEEVERVTVWATRVDDPDNRLEQQSHQPEADGHWRVVFNLIGRGRYTLEAHAYDSGDQPVLEATSDGAVAIGRGAQSITLHLRPSHGPCPEVDCANLDGVCVVGVVNEADCSCTTEPRRDDTSCNDQNVCTEPDRCQAGVCVGPRLDADGDGVSPHAECAELIDCDDSDASVRPHAHEICDGKDNDCDGVVDNRCDEGTRVTGRFEPAVRTLGTQSGWQVRNGRFHIVADPDRTLRGERFEVPRSSNAHD